MSLAATSAHSGGHLGGHTRPDRRPGASRSKAVILEAASASRRDESPPIATAPLEHGNVNAPRSAKACLLADGHGRRRATPNDWAPERGPDSNRLTSK
ncbi:hypothetical protein PHYPSEUDO_006518 [Phytophthora pseudosyringae]|uniref:Uncharacterized protein n=1 Tax=Phytophthora pseudosyringae TaxID=221518 RepID=A0A8T1VID6_9STRA|nr:hypothetical protein PHYPSEUDO_006518 [Phytophthora pseudosyringae]